MTPLQVSAALDAMFKHSQGLYGSFDNIPFIAQAGHTRRMELLDRLDIGDVSGMTVVDFGMGSWGFASVFPKLHNCARAIGMDISNAALKISKDLIAQTRPAYADRFEIYQSDGMDLPLPSGSADLFFSGESIEHVKFPPRYLGEIHRVLHEKGQLVITSPNRDAVRYKEQGEEYCTSPEHFWLFNTPELISAVSEFFDIQEIYGFNGSYGSHEEDRAETDPESAKLWSRRFEHEPEKATGVILRAVAKSDIKQFYRLVDLPSSQIEIVGGDTYLPLEFGLKGLLLDSPAASITLTRPLSDGIVVRFWSHRWSGRAESQLSPRPIFSTSTRKCQDGETGRMRRPPPDRR